MLLARPELKVIRDKLTLTQHWSLAYNNTSKVAGVLLECELTVNVKDYYGVVGLCVTIVSQMKTNHIPHCM